MEGGFGYCAPVGAVSLDASCSGDASACAPGLVCASSGTPAARCLASCQQGVACPEGHWCDPSPARGGPVLCAPKGERAEGATCLDDRWSCAEGLHCVGAGAQWADCRAACGPPFGSCGAGQDCRYVGGGRAYCFPSGAGQQGADCSTSPAACGPGTLCVAIEGDKAICAAACLPGVTCASPATCQAVDLGEVRYCLGPAGKAVAAPLPPY